MTKRSVKLRYNDFCKDATELLNRTGCLTKGQTRTIEGKPFWVMCDNLIACHFPEDDSTIFGHGPRAIIHNLNSMEDGSRSDTIDYAVSTAEVIKMIIETRPPLDPRELSTPKDFSHCAFYEKDRSYVPNPNAIFVLMPFTQSWSGELWEEHICPYLTNNPSDNNLVVRRADDMHGQGVMEDIYEGIVTAKLIVADCTRRNANVLYELGLAHAIGKQTVLLAQNVRDIPFDLQQFRFCIYQNISSGHLILKHFLHATIHDVFDDSN